MVNRRDDPGLRPGLTAEVRSGPLIPSGLTKTADIYADSHFFSGEDGELLWKVGIHRDTDWRRPANEVVMGIAGKPARKFPCRDSGI